MVSFDYIFKPKKIYMEHDAKDFPQGIELYEKYSAQEIEIEWIDKHHNIESLRNLPNSEFTKLKQYLIIGTRKSLNHQPNNKTSDFLVPYTSSGCSAFCMYCYLVCHYFTSSYLRIFVNRDKMMEKLKKHANTLGGGVFEIGSNSDLILENTVTKNLEWTIEQFGTSEYGTLTLPTKFCMVDSILDLSHKQKVTIRMSVNPEYVIQNVEFGTSSLKDRVLALNKLYNAGYPVGILIAPIILLPNWEEYYIDLINFLSLNINKNLQNGLKIEMIFMTYGTAHRKINMEAFPNAVNLYDEEKMRFSGRQKYSYNKPVKEDAKELLVKYIKDKMPKAEIVYIV
jgi:spore photoproduct lyase